MSWFQFLSQRVLRGGPGLMTVQEGLSTTSNTQPNITLFRTAIAGSAVPVPALWLGKGQSSPVFLGLIASGYRLPITLPETSGSLFIAGGEKAERIDCQLQEGAHYALEVKPRPGFWSASFTLKPITDQDAEAFALKATLSQLPTLILSEQAYRWFNEHRETIQEKLDAVNDLHAKIAVDAQLKLHPQETFSF